MNNSKMSRIFSLLAGMCLAAYGIALVWDYYRIISSRWHYSISFQDIALCFFYLAFAVLLFIGKKNIGFLIPTGVAIYLEGYGLSRYYSTRTLLDLVLFSLLFVVFLMSVIPPMAKNTGIAIVLCYVYIVLTVIIWITQKMRFGRITLTWIFMMAENAGYLLMGLWLRSTMVIPRKAVQQNAYAAMNPQAAAPSQNDAIGGADKLKIYKDLLDSGAITQEEFDAKKKQILGL